mgnify:CR=1 FL=1
MVSTIQDRLGVRFRRIITSSSDGVPPWLEDVAAGDDAGLYKPTDAPWVVHANFTTLVGGIRALLMQALHPGSLAGVEQHSRYEVDALGRLAGTTRWLTILTFGSKSAIAKESARVNGMHSRVKGEYTSGSGEVKSYRAADSDLLLWVHVAFTDSFLVTHQLYSGVDIPGGADAYVSLWAKAVEPLGLTSCPMTKGELSAVIETFDEEGLLVVNDTTLRVVKFIKRPPLSRTARFAYAFLFQAAVASMPQKYRDRLGLKSLPLWLIQPVTKGLLNLMRLAVGDHSPIEEAALERLARIGALPQ